MELEKESDKLLRLRELVDPIRLDMEPSNLWDNWCCWIAIDKACRWSKSSSNKLLLLDDLSPILLLLDPMLLIPSLASFLVMQINLLPISSSCSTSSSRSRNSSVNDRSAFTKDVRKINWLLLSGCDYRL